MLQILEQLFLKTPVLYKKLLKRSYCITDWNTLEYLWYVVFDLIGDV